MGGGRFTDSDWKSYSSIHVEHKSTAEVYSSRSIKNELDPKGVKVRESCDSIDNPNSTAVIVALDVTGSMSSVLDSMVRKGLNTLITEIYSRKPVTDPHLMIMGVGDVEYDRSPLQVTQFEADIRIAEQLTKIYLEQGGGGNNYESYILPWYFAGHHTKIDCFEKRNKKGFLFTIGDEQPTPYLLTSQLELVLGYKPEGEKLTAEDLLTLVSRQYEVFHLMVEEGSYFSRSEDKVVKGWTELLGQRAIRLADHTKLAEVIVSTLQIVAGEVDTKTVIDSWSRDTSLVVAKAIDGLANVKSEGGIVKF